MLDQLKLPHEFVYDNVSTCEEAFDCIRSMRVRGKLRSCVEDATVAKKLSGAPAIAIVAALALAVELESKSFGKSR